MIDTNSLPDFNASPKYVSCVETAKLLRKALKAAFPSTKFSVRSDSYAGGASIHFSWVDGPRTTDVEAISSGFAGGRFDGSIDLAYSVKSWMMPNGAIVAESRGTESSMGSDRAFVNSAPHPEAILVRFGANYVFASRQWSDATRDAICAPLWARYGFTYTPGPGAERWSVNPDQLVTLDGSSSVESINGGRFHGQENLWTLAQRYFGLWDGVTNTSVCTQCDKAHADNVDCYEGGN